MALWDDNEYFEEGWEGSPQHQRAEIPDSVARDFTHADWEENKHHAVLRAVSDPKIVRQIILLKEYCKKYNIPFTSSGDNLQIYKTLMEDYFPGWDARLIAKEKAQAYTKLKERLDVLAEHGFHFTPAISFEIAPGKLTPPLSFILCESYGMAANLKRELEEAGVHVVRTQMRKNGHGTLLFVPTHELHKAGIAEQATLPAALGNIKEAYSENEYKTALRQNWKTDHHNPALSQLTADPEVIEMVLDAMLDLKLLPQSCVTNTDGSQTLRVDSDTLLAAMQCPPQPETAPSTDIIAHPHNRRGLRE